MNQSMIVPIIKPPCKVNVHKNGAMSTRDKEPERVYRYSKTRS